MTGINAIKSPRPAVGTAGRRMPSRTPQRLTAPIPWRRAQRATRLLLRPVLRAYFEMHATGLEHIPPHGPYLLAANHVSMLDWAFLFYFFREALRCTAHPDYFAHPLVRVALRLNGAVPIGTDRLSHGAFRVARAVLAAGEPLVLFPEGGISRTGRPAAGHPGVIALAAVAQVPILPVAIRGAFEVFPRHRRLPRPGTVSVTFGPLLPPPTATDRSAQRALVGRLMTYIGALLDGVPNPDRPW